MPSVTQQAIRPDKLPHEILLVILEATRAPRYQLDPSVTACHGSNSAWLAELRFRKALILVCKWWSGLATELFYEDIVLRRMGQIIALADTLTANHGTQRNLAVLVKSIRLDTCIILGPCADAVRDALSSILSLCVALRTFEYHTAKDFAIAPAPPPGDASGVFNPTWFVDDRVEAFQLAFQERVSMLTVLDLATPLSHKQVAHLHRLLAIASCLETLKVGRVQRVEGEGDHFDSLPVLHLPKLKELYIPVDDVRFVAFVSTMWVMPGLRRLTTLGAQSSIPHALLAAHGALLVYLHLYPESCVYPWDVEPRKEDYERVLQLCPAVEHLALVLPLRAMFLDTPTLSISAICALSPALRYLDVWAFVERCIDHHCQRIAESGVYIRYLNTRLLSPDLPAICDPQIRLADDETRIVHLPSCQAAWSRHTIFLEPTGLSIERALMRSNADEWPSEYSPEHEDSRSDADSEETVDSDSSTPEDTGSEISEEPAGDTEGSEVDAVWAEKEDEDEEDESISEHESDYWLADEKLDHATVLTMFRGSHDDDQGSSREV